MIRRIVGALRGGDPDVVAGAVLVGLGAVALLVALVVAVVS